MTRLAAAGLAVLALSAPPAAAQESAVAVLQGLDKVTARISAFDAPVDRPVRFGTLRIVVRYCRKRPPEEPPETTAFLEIYETPRDGPSARLFSGWMFASSPALASLEHPVYDIWVVDCRTASTSAGAAAR